MVGEIKGLWMLVKAFGCCRFLVLTFAPAGESQREQRERSLDSLVLAPRVCAWRAQAVWDLSPLNKRERRERMTRHQA